MVSGHGDLERLEHKGTQVGRTAKSYIYSVIVAGVGVLAVAVVNWSSPDPLLLAIYLLLAVLASAVKLRLPGVDGT